MANFVIWSASELVVLKTTREMIRFLREAMDKATTVFKYGVFPELLAKWYTHIPFSEPQQSIDKPSKT